MPGIDSSRKFVPLNIAILTISDTRKLENDRSGDALQKRLLDAGHVLAARSIVKDDRDEIQTQVSLWAADEGVDIIISTGGTGFTGRDVTPESVEPLFDKKMDGFSTIFQQISYEKNRHIYDSI